MEPAAVEAGAEVTAAMLSGRDDIARCMARNRAELAIIPMDRTLTSLPEYAYLKGTRDFTGRARDTFEIRGRGRSSRAARLIRGGRAGAGTHRTAAPILPLPGPGGSA